MGHCKIDHSGTAPKKLANLPESQRGHWRHRCAACAYQMGLEDGIRKGAQKARTSMAQHRTASHQHRKQPRA